MGEQGVVRDSQELEPLSQGEGEVNCPAASVHLETDGGSGDQASPKSICLVEMAPTNSRLQGGDESVSDWKPELSQFSNRKTSRHLSREDSRQLSNRTRKYYKAQDRLIEEFEALEEKGVSDDEDEQDSHDIISLRLSQASLACNFLLLVAKAVAAGLSGSISIISSLVDSVVDLLSGAVIWYTSRAVLKSNPYIYPSGRARLEPVAVVVLSVIMSLASFQLIIESIQKIVTFTTDKSSVPHFEIPTIVITAFTVVIKLALFLACYLLGKKRGKMTSSIQVLMQDHRNDILSNSIALICGYLGSSEFVEKTGEDNVVFIDPIGAIIIGVYILITWWITGNEHIKMLTGVTAKPQFLSKITWICLNHNPQITKIETVRAFHFGSRFLVEVDIVLPRDMTLDTTHEIGESLQQKLENLRDVERAFVHVDWETDHRPETEHRLN